MANRDGLDMPRAHFGILENLRHDLAPSRQSGPTQILDAPAGLALRIHRVERRRGIGETGAIEDARSRGS